MSDGERGHGPARHRRRSSRLAVVVLASCAAGVVVSAVAVAAPVVLDLSRTSATGAAGDPRSPSSAPVPLATSPPTVYAEPFSDDVDAVAGAPADLTTPATPFTTPSGQYSGVPEGTAVAYGIPDLVSSLAALPAPPEGEWEVQDLGQYRLQPVVPGQACSSRPPFNVAGRQWSWYRSGHASVGVVVTGWRAGRGHAAFDDVVRDAGICRFTDEQQPVAVTVPAAAEAWAATSSFANGVPVVHGAARVGDLVIGVEVADTGKTGVDQVEQLLQAISTEMAASGLLVVTR